MANGWAWILRHPGGRYALALLIVCVGLGMRHLLPLPPGLAVYLPSFAAVAFSAWLGGRGPGMVATLASAVGINFLYLEPIYTLGIKGEHAHGLVFYLALGLVASEFATSRRRARQALSQSEERFLTMAENLSEVLWILSLVPERMLYVSPSYERIWGRPTRDLLEDPRRWLAAVHPDDRDRAANLFAAWLAGERATYDVEYRIVRPDGTTAWIHDRGTLIRDATGKAYRAGGIADDITERKLMDERLRAGEELWRATFENHPTMYFLIEADGAIRMANRYATEQLGYSIEELHGRPAFEIFHPDDHQLVQQGLASCLERLGEAMRWEARKLRKDGTPIWVRESARAVARPDGVPIVLVASEDITEARRAEEALADARTELAHVTRVTTLGELSASIAHEVNQPIAAIVNNASACLRWLSAQNLEEARHCAAIIVSDGHRAGEIVRRIRDLAKKAPPEKHALDVNDVVRDVLTLARGELARQHVTLHTALAEGLAPLHGDRVQLQQVVLNLLVNAIDAVSSTDGPRDVWVTTGQGGAHGSVQIAVRDSGPGLETANLDRLFRPFYTTKPQGMGMGLAISRSIVEAHGGHLSAEPSSPRGALFKLTLPVATQLVA